MFTLQASAMHTPASHGDLTSPCPHWCPPGGHALQVHSMPPAHSLSNVKHPALSWPGRSRGPTAGPGWDDRAHLPSPRPLPTSLPRTILTSYSLCNTQNPCPQDPSFKVKTQALPAADGPASGRLAAQCRPWRRQEKDGNHVPFFRRSAAPGQPGPPLLWAQGPGKVPTRASPGPCGRGLRGRAALGRREREVLLQVALQLRLSLHPRLVMGQFRKASRRRRTMPSLDPSVVLSVLGCCTE